MAVTTKHLISRAVLAAREITNNPKAKPFHIPAKKKLLILMTSPTRAEVQRALRDLEDLKRIAEIGGTK